MLKIGLTGGIGSGKTTVAKVFETLGIPVYYADEATKRLMNSDENLKYLLIKNFGEATYKNGELDRKYLANIVFNDKDKLELLNSITHPATINDAEEWIKDQTTSYIIKEAALLFESGAAKNLDYFIGVYSPEELRINRVMQRDNISREEVLQRLSKQMDENKKMELCDFVIINNEEELVVPQILGIHQQLLKLSKTKSEN